jgi:hypothetical protein
MESCFGGSADELIEEIDCKMSNKMFSRMPDGGGILPAAMKPFYPAKLPAAGCQADAAQ